MTSFEENRILSASVNSFVGILFVASFALGAGLLIWDTAFDRNPVSDAFAAIIISETQLPR